MLEAPQNVQRDRVQREQAIEMAAEDSCRASCRKLWLKCALEVLQLNNID